MRGSPIDQLEQRRIPQLWSHETSTPPAVRARRCGTTLYRCCRLDDPGRSATLVRRVTRSGDPRPSLSTTPIEGGERQERRTLTSSRRGGGSGLYPAGGAEEARGSRPRSRTLPPTVPDTLGPTRRKAGISRTRKGAGHTCTRRGLLARWRGTAKRCRDRPAPSPRAVWWRVRAAASHSWATPAAERWGFPTARTWSAASSG